MSLPGRLFRFFVFSNLFITCCAVLMIWQTYELLLHVPPDPRFILFAASATFCSYSFHWYLTPNLDLPSARLGWLRKNRWVHITFFFVGLIGVAYYGILLIRHWQWLLLCAFITFLYSAPKIPHPYFRSLRKVALGKTIFLAFVWMYVTTVLPLQLSDLPWRGDFTFFALSRFFLVYAICILFDYRDRDYDRSIGIRSLITRLSTKGITWLFVLSLLLFIVFTIFLFHYGYSHIIILLLLTPGIILAIIYPYATKYFSDILYYFILDGLMALSAILTLLPIN